MATRLEPFLLALIRSRTEEHAFVARFDQNFKERFGKSAATRTKRAMAFYSSSAKKLLKQFDLGQVLRRTDEQNRDFVRIIVDANEIYHTLDRQKPFIPELVPEWASGTEYMHNREPFIEAFSSALADELKTIVKGLISTEDFEKLQVAIEQTSKSAPVFEPVKGRLKFKPVQIIRPSRERKALAKQKCAQAKSICERQANKHPDIKALIDQYDDALQKLRSGRGVYSIFLAGQEIETLLRVKSSTSYDDDRNPQIDADLLFALNSLITAHAGLVMQFPDVVNFTHELDQYRRQSESLDALRNRILDPVLSQLSGSKNIFDEDTRHLTELVNNLGVRERDSGLSPSANVVAVKHGWLRGTLAAIGRLILKNGSEFAKAARDGVIGGAAFEIAKRPETLVGAITLFLIGARGQLLQLADQLPAAFGWLRQMLSLLGL